MPLRSCSVHELLVVRPGRDVDAAEAHARMVPAHGTERPRPRRAARRADARADRHPFGVTRRGVDRGPRARRCCPVRATSATPACWPARRARGCCSAGTSTPSRPRATAPAAARAAASSGSAPSDMKGALAVMIELVRDGLPFGALFFGREELPFGDSALTPLLARHPLSPELVGDDGADRQRDPRRLPRQRQRHVDVPRRRRALRPAVVRRQRDHARRRGRDRAGRARAGAAPVRRARVHRGARR